MDSIMGRLSTVDDASVFKVVGSQVALHGGVTLQDVVATTGVSIGSLYHRYGSREELLARAWLDAVTAFQSRFLAELESGAPDAGERAAMSTPQFCRADAERALVLICCRREELLSDAISSALKEQIKSINTRVSAALTEFAITHGYSLDACRLGLVGYPLGAVRLYLPKQKVPKRVDAYVASAFRSAIEMEPVANV
jgi:AcrR family transcriptional regulator